MDCHGVYIAENTFVNNVGCSNSVGNVIIACIPEKSSRSIFFSDTESSAEGSSWLKYYPSVTEDTGTSELDYNTITQVVLTKFIQHISDEKGSSLLISFYTFELLNLSLDTMVSSQHPFRDEMIDISRINVKLNNFTGNYAGLSQLYIQGAFNVDLQQNRLEYNSTLR